MPTETHPKGAAPSAEACVAALQAEFLRLGNEGAQLEEKLFTALENGDTTAAEAVRARIAAIALRRQEIGLQCGGPLGSPERGLVYKANCEKAQRLADELSASNVRVQENGRAITLQRKAVLDAEAALKEANVRLAKLTSNGCGHYEAQLALKKFLVAHQEIAPQSLLPTGAFLNV